jgi:hypothetical protein
MDVGLYFSCVYNSIKIDTLSIGLENYFDTYQFCCANMLIETLKPWLFFGVEFEAEGRLVQDWYDGIRIEAQEEITDLVAHLRVRTGSLWERPDYDPLDGEGGISEIRPRNIRDEDGSHTYRLYGIRGYPDTMSYTFLYGSRKDVKNDVEGKYFARERLQQLYAESFRRGEPAVHRFDFEGSNSPQT